MKYLTILLSSLFLVSCGKHRDGTSVWAEWGWVVPIIPLIPAFIFFRMAYLASKSGSDQQNQHVKGGRVEFKENIPMHKQAVFWMGVVCVLATIGIIIGFNWEKG